MPYHLFSGLRSGYCGRLIPTGGRLLSVPEERSS